LFLMNRKAMKLSLGFSPCPNDTFIFDALVHHKVDTEGLEFDVFLGDVEELNQKAFKNELDITKLSYHAFAYLLKDYALLNAGSALGRNCGPLLIAKKELSKQEIEQGTIAIPGKYTTANLLLSLAFPDAKNKKNFLFSDIEPAILKQEVDAGLIIHENRFTYQDKGLVKLMDLGEFWETETGHPIPLGGIVVNRNIEKTVQQKIDRILARSVAFAIENPSQTQEYVSCHAQEMDKEVMYAHIALYVNHFTKDLGEEGKAAVLFLLKKAQSLGLIPLFKGSVFV